MEDKDLQFLNSFTEKLSDTLVKQCTADGMLDGKMLLVEELNDKWRTSAPEYMVDAVPQIAEYPSAAIAWACYVGMGAAVLWDKSWGDYKDTEDWYSLMSKPRGFDCLDEYVIEWNIRHMFFKPYIDDADFLTIMEQFTFALALSEIEAMRLSVDGKIEPSSIRMKMNDTLKAVIKGEDC